VCCSDSAVRCFELEMADSSESSASGISESIFHASVSTGSVSNGYILPESEFLGFRYVGNWNTLVARVIYADD
jgi:hypothetical protein